MYMLLACITNVHHCTFESRRGHQKYETEVICNCWLSQGCWELNSARAASALSEPFQHQLSNLYANILC